MGSVISAEQVDLDQAMAQKAEARKHIEVPETSNGEC
jgi:hypothetical protein